MQTGSVNGYQNWIKLESVICQNVKRYAVEVDRSQKKT